MPLGAAASSVSIQTTDSEGGYIPPFFYGISIARMAVKRDDFIWSIGYQDDAAVVDGFSRKKYRGYSASQLLEAGLYRAAFCAAIFDQIEESFLEQYRKVTGQQDATIASLQRLYGVFSAPDHVNKVVVIQ